ncbi:hypothetical protein B0T24DRAFT_642320 [Lasiosphaeria ovina]|uniref:Ankyrin repeat domain-containing protein 54 n=1 Tax=Lasiosphaeria ovina TaxID=92902 RepID=A0AAE0JSL0_9PEZI|nr:hypothetical protein B0T24DRAFT_642320 [Lasiosphaeria ovina]
MQTKVQASSSHLSALQSLNSRLLERISNIETSDAAIDSEALAAIVRAEMQNVLLSLGGSVLPGRPVTDGPLAQSAQRIPDQIGRDFLLSEESGRDAGTSTSTQDAEPQSHERLSMDLADFGPSTRSIRPTKQTTRFSRQFLGGMGVLEVTVTTIKQPLDHGSGRRGTRKTVIKVTFRPAAWLPLVGVETSLKLEAGHRGFNNIQPGLRWFSVVPNDSLVFESIKLGDLDNLKYLFTHGLASPFDQNDDGLTPPHHAAAVANSEICSYLISEGADLAASDRWGWRPLDTFHLLATEQISLGATVEHSRSQPSLQDYMHCCRILTTTAHDSSDTFDDYPIIFMNTNGSSSREIGGSEATLESRPEFTRQWCCSLIQQGVQYPDHPVLGLQEIGMTLLHVKASDGELGLWGLHMLVFCGADVNAVGAEGETALALLLQNEVDRRNRRILRNCLRFLLAYVRSP